MEPGQNRGPANGSVVTRTRRTHAIVTALLDRLAKLIAAVLGTFPSAQYARLSRWRDGARPAKDERRGFIVIQIDGVSYDHLRAAIELGYAPHLSRLLSRDEMRLHPWKPGVPGTTPASQAGIMFGSSAQIPAYRWYDKSTGQIKVSSQPEVAQALQSELTQDRPGILKAGSSYMNVFDGGAERALFTLGTFGRHRLFEGLRGFGFLLLFSLNPFRTAALLVLSVWEYLTDLAQRIQATLRQTTPRPLSRAFPFLRVMSNVVMREIQTFSVSLDIFSGVPAIYTTYYGFDELAHHYGPRSRPALRALRAIDSRVRRIDRYRRMNVSRPYDLFLLSDHGMTDDIPFSVEYGQTLGELVQDLVGRSAAIRELISAQQADLPSMLFVQRELSAIGADSPPAISRLSQYLLHYVESRVPIELDAGDYEPAQPSDVVVSSSGSLSHIYLNAKTEQLSLTQIATLYPTLVPSLLSHPGIWLVLGREEGKTIIFGKEGVISVAESTRIEGQNPLQQLAYGEWAVRQLSRLASLANSGDLILVGAYDADAQCVSCFENQWACHGGLGGPQDMAVFMTESHIDWPLASLDRAAEVYNLFIRQYDIT